MTKKEKLMIKDVSFLQDKSSEKSSQPKSSRLKKKICDPMISVVNEPNFHNKASQNNRENQGSNVASMPDSITAFESNLCLFAERISKIGRKPVLGLDVFDTILIRKIDRPSDVFAVVDNYACSQFSFSDGSYYKLRIRAEREARILMANMGRHEITFDDIANQISNLCDLKRDQIDMLIQCEIEYEKSFVAPRIDVLKVIARNAFRFSAIHLISDTYFSSKTVNEFLELANVRDYLGDFKIHLSSQVDETKHQGNLIPWVLEKEKIGRECFLYVGDNIRSDVINTNKARIRALNVPKTSDFCKAADLYFYEGVRFLRPRFSANAEMRHSNGIAASILQSIISNRSALSREFNPEGRAHLTFSSALATLWCGFVSHIYESVILKDIPHVFFLSRDGHVFHRLWSELYPDRNASYLHVSREVLYKIYFAIDYEKACSYVVQNYSDHSLGESIGRLFDDKKICSRISKDVAAVGYDLDLSVEAQPGSMEYVTAEFKEQLLQQSKSRYQRYLAYLNKTGFLSYSKVAIVDLGWHGSLQKILREMLQHAGHRIELNGYYLGLFEGSPENSYNCYYDGYLCERSQVPSFEKELRESPSLIEILHAAPHGSTQDISSESVPVLRQNDIQEAVLKKVSSIQDEAISIILEQLKPLLHFAGEKSKMLTVSESFAIMSRILINPNKEEVLIASRFSLCPDFGLDKAVSLLSLAGKSASQSHWRAGSQVLKNLELHKKQSIPEWFDEMKYLRANPDVAAAVAEQKFFSGYDHYLRYGKQENRALTS